MKSADDIRKNKWFLLTIRLMPVCGSLFCLMFCAVISMNLWNKGTTVESWDKVTAKVVDRRVERKRRHDGYEQRVEIDVRYSFNGTEHRRTFVNPNKLLTDPTGEIYVNPEKPSQSSLGFERGLFLAYALFSIISFIAIVLLSILTFCPHLASKDYLYETYEPSA